MGCVCGGGGGCAVIMCVCLRGWCCNNFIVARQFFISCVCVCVCVCVRACVCV